MTELEEEMYEAEIRRNASSDHMVVYREDIRFLLTRLDKVKERGGLLLGDVKNLRETLGQVPQFAVDCIANGVTVLSAGEVGTAVENFAQSALTATDHWFVEPEKNT